METVFNMNYFMFQVMLLMKVKHLYLHLPYLIAIFQIKKS